MKKQIICYLLFLSMPVFAQTALIRGTVATTTGQGIPFLTVTLRLATDSSLVKADIADANGVFTFTGLRAAAYRIGLTGVGYTSFTSEVIVLTENQALTLPKLELSQAVESLNEVRVKATKPLVDVQTDKIVLNIESSLTSAGNSALELLQKAPGVQVDPSDNIVLQGKNGVRVYINGKPSPLSPNDLAAYLRTLQATDIEAIEIITQPSASYDAQGNAGIINIRLKKNCNFGTNGSATLGLAQGQYYPKYNGAVSLNSRTAKANVFASYSQRNARDWSYINLYREQSGQYFDQTSQTTARSVAQNARLGADWFAGTRSTIGLLLDGSLNNGTNATLGRTPIGKLGKGPDSLLIANNQSGSDRANGNANLNYRFADTTGRELSIDADLGQFRSTGDNYQPNQYLNPISGEVLSERNYRMETRTDVALRTLKADYTQRIWGGKLIAGAKVSRVQTDNYFTFFDVLGGQDVVNDNRTNRFVYTEAITAGYASFEKSKGKWQGQIGLRVERTHSDGQLTSASPQTDSHVSRQYVNAFPSAGLTYQYSPKHRFSVTYSRRIDRPTYQSLNPFESKLDELTYQKGNAFLRPQYTNTLQLSHTLGYKLTTSLSYSDTQDFFTQITDTTERNRNYITTRNLANQQVLSLNVSYPISLAKWWSIFASMNAYRLKNQANFGEGKTIGLTTNVVSLYMQHTISLPHSWRLEATAFYTSPSIWGGTFLNRRYWGSTIGLQRKVLAEQGSVVLTVSDPFNGQHWHGISQFGGLYMDASGGFESRQVRLNFTYNFGRSQIKAARQRKTSFDEESKRL